MFSPVSSPSPIYKSPLASSILGSKVLNIAIAMVERNVGQEGEEWEITAFYYKGQAIEMRNFTVMDSIVIQIISLKYASRANHVTICTRHHH